MKINLNIHNKSIKTQDLNFSYSKRLLHRPKSQTESASHSSVSISDSAKLRQLYNKELLQSPNSSDKTQTVSNGSTDYDKVSSLSLEDLLKNYEKIYKNINENMTGSDKTSNLEALDAVFNNIAGLKADSIATSFDNIFDYAANNLSANGMNSADGILDKDLFKVKLTDKIITAKNQFLDYLPTMNSDDAFKKAISMSGKSGTLNSLEDMSLKDISNISDVIKNGFSTNGDTLDVMVRWYKSYNQIIDNLNLSKDLKDKLINNSLDNIKAFAKIKIYKEETTNNDTSLEKLAKKLKALYEALDSISEKLEKSTDMNQKLRYLKREAGLKEQIGKLTKEKNEIENRQRKLKQNPDSIEDNDNYKNIMEKFKKYIENNN